MTTPVATRRPSTRAARGLVLMVVAVLVAMLVPLLRSPDAAAAVPGCPPGSSLSYGLCVDMNGKYLGRVDAAGKFVPKYMTPNELATVRPVNKPSSVLAGANSSTGTTAQNSLRARANGLANKIKLAPKIGQAFAVIQAAQLGYTIGKGIASMACGWGVDLLCTPQKVDNFMPNSDVTLTAGDPGWSNNGTGTFCYQASSPKYCWSARLAFASGSGPFNYGDKTVNPLTIGATAYRIIDSSMPTGNLSSFKLRMDLQVHCQGGADSGYGVVQNFGPTADGSPGAYTYQPSTTYAASSTSPQTFCANNSGSGSGGLGYFFVPQYVNQASSPNDAVRYYPNGNPSRAVASDPNPVRTLRTINTCSTGGSTQSDSPQFKETDAAFPSYPVAAPCASGSVVKVEVFERASGLADKLIWSMNIPQVVSDFAGGVGNFGSNPDQATCGKNAGEGCVLGLYRKTDPNAGDCFTDVARCQGWFKSATRDSDYQCTYGPVGSKINVDIRECYVYSVTFEPVYRAKGVEYGDPKDGAGPETLDPEDPSTGTGKDPAKDPNGGEDGDPSCYPSGWSVFNPIEWIVRPITCVLKYLFIPGADAFSDLANGLNSAIGNTSLSKWGASLSGVGNLTGIASNGCGGATLHVPKLGQLTGTEKDYSIFSTCEQPWSTISTVVKALITLALAWGTIMACYRIIASAFGLELAGASK